MKICPNCGFKSNPIQTKCPKCGIIFKKWEAIQAIEQGTEKPENKKIQLDREVAESIETSKLGKIHSILKKPLFFTGSAAVLIIGIDLCVGGIFI